MKGKSLDPENGDWWKKEWKNISPTSWPCPGMACPETHIGFLVSSVFLTVDYLGHLHSYSDWGPAAAGVGESWQASCSLNWGRLRASFLWKACLFTPHCLSLLTRSQMYIHICFTSGDPLIWPQTPGFIQHIPSHIETFLPCAERKTS